MLNFQNLVGKSLLSCWALPESHSLSSTSPNLTANIHYSWSRYAPVCFAPGLLFAGKPAGKRDGLREGSTLISPVRYITCKIYYNHGNKCGETILMLKSMSGWRIKSSGNASWNQKRKQLSLKVDSWKTQASPQEDVSAWVLFKRKL